MRSMLVLLAVLLVSPAAAETVYKCKGAKGQAVYQSFPCGGQKPAPKMWSGEYRQPSNAEVWARYNRDQEWKRRQRIEMQRGSVYVAPSHSSADMTRGSYAAQCSYSRSEYNRVQADFKLNRNIQLLRNLEAQIYKYCVSRP